MKRNLFTAISLIIAAVIMTIPTFGNTISQATPDTDTCQDVKGSIQTSDKVEDIFQKGYMAYEKKNYDEAVVLFKEAADMGHGRAQFYLGYCYYYGLSVPQDYLESAKLFSKSAEYGYAAAQ